MAEGRVRAVGTSAELKSRFGKGFKLTITCADHDNKPQAIEYAPTSLPHYARRLHRFVCPMPRSFTRSPQLALHAQVREEAGVRGQGHQ
jgi:hypothetical protein